MKDSLLAHGRQGWRREDRNLHQQKNHSFSRLYHDSLAYFWQVARNVVVRQWQIYTLRKKKAYIDRRSDSRPDYVSTLSAKQLERIFIAL